MKGLPSPAVVAKAQLPARYSAAKTALSEAVRVDEVKDWKDKAAALASYARQQDDRSLEEMALKIRARATRRIGELLPAFQPHGPKGGRPSKNGGGKDTVSQRSAARSAGLSKGQEVQARRIAAIPQAEFEALVEREDPPTLTELEERGKRILERPKQDGFKEATYAMGALRRFAEHCEQQTPARICNGLDDEELGEAKRVAKKAMSWLERFVDTIERRQER